MLKALLVECGNDNSLLENELSNNGIDFLKVRHSPFFITFIKESSPDIIIVNVDSPSDTLLTDLHKLAQQLPLPIVIFANDDSKEVIEKTILAEVSDYIVGNLPYQRLNSILQVAIARFNHQQALKTALEEARSLLEDRKQIDRAKAILIKTQKFSEDEAYHTIRKLAMDRNITLGEMARKVITMAELLK